VTSNPSLSPPLLAPPCSPVDGQGHVLPLYDMGYRLPGDPKCMYGILYHHHTLSHSPVEGQGDVLPLAEERLQNLCVVHADQAGGYADLGSHLQVDETKGIGVNSINNAHKASTKAVDMRHERNRAHTNYHPSLLEALIEPFPHHTPHPPLPSHHAPTPLTPRQTPPPRERQRWRAPSPGRRSQQSLHLRRPAERSTLS
jgi:hypothetical protein